MPESNLHKLSALGQSVWNDYLSRQMLQSGKLAKMMEQDAVVGVTSNPTIFQKAISEGDAYDEQLKEILESGEQDPKETFLQLTSHDISDACDLLRKVWDESQGLDGYVSWEVDPTLAYDRDGTVAEARRLHEWIDKPNLYVKIPATEPGLEAIEEMIASGKSINVTLIFSLERHKEVMEAYIHGLERLVESGGDPSQVHSVASFFVSRVDTETDRRLDQIGGDAKKLKGKLAVANAKLAYQNYLDAFAGPRWDALEAKGASKQRCLWASTSTKNPEYRDVMYIEELIGPETVNTMPEETMAAFQDHGRVAPTLTQHVDAARKLLDDLAAAGVDYDDVTYTLEREGVQIVDGGNSNFRDSKRRYAEAQQHGIHFVDAGVSGGIWGLEVGFCLMVGGDDEPVGRLEPIFESLAPEEGYAHVGPSGAGHFVKMVHNGIEYGLMQSYAEGFEIMEHSEYDLDAHAISGIWRNGSVVRSWLLELLHAAFEQHGGKLEDIAPYVEDSGEGRWTITEAINENVPAPVIAASLFARFASRDEIKFSAKVAAALRQQFGGHAVKALEKAKAGQDPR